METAFTKQVGIDVPLICGPMYPCSNAELVAAVSEAGGMGVVQPISLVYVHGEKDFRSGLRHIKRLTDKPFGFNALIEKTVKAYENRMRQWIEIAIDEGVRFIITALGNPKWVVDLAKPAGVVVYHDCVDRKWAEKAVDCGVDGIICVNNRAGGHAGYSTPESLFEELGDLGVPLICAGGIGDEQGFVKALNMGYAGVQMGTRFIATHECRSHIDYKRAILRAKADDVVLTDKISGVPCAVIKTPYIESMGTKAGPVAKWLLKNRTTKHWVRGMYNLRGLWQLKRASARGASYLDYFQAGKSVDGVHELVHAGEVVERCAAAARAQMGVSLPVST